MALCAGCGEEMTEEELENETGMCLSCDEGNDKLKCEVD